MRRRRHLVLEELANEADSAFDVDALLRGRPAEANDSTTAIEARCAYLEAALQRQTGELRRAREEMAAARRATQDARLDTIRRLVAAAECKDHDTAAHIERIGRYS